MNTETHTIPLVSLMCTLVISLVVAEMASYSQIHSFLWDTLPQDKIISSFPLKQIPLSSRFTQKSFSYKQLKHCAIINRISSTGNGLPPNI